MDQNNISYEINLSKYNWLANCELELIDKLMANENFMQLQEELTGTENKIAYSRQFYNDSVQDWNTKLQSFPSNFLAKMFGFGNKEFFKTEGVEREVVKVKF